MATRRNAGYNVRCSDCGGWVWTIWSKHELTALPQLVPIAGDARQAWSRDQVDLEIACATCFALAALYAAASAAGVVISNIG